jgi:hypothetical protein
MLTDLDISLFERLVDDDTQDLPRETARALLKLGFSKADRKRIELLSEKANEGTLTPPESEELESFIRIGDLLAILHARAELAIEHPDTGS